MTDSASGAYSITGGTGADTLKGGSGADTIIGGIGNDTITGNGGADIITGNAGNDNLTGNAGNDRFNVDLGTDTITDLGGTGGSESDILVVSAGATANATDINSFTATSDTRNDGTANLTARSAGGTIDLTNSAAAGYTITSGA